jgi:voltage-gated potassium channel
MFVFDKILHRVVSEDQRYTTLLWSLIIVLLMYPVMARMGWSRFWSLFFIAELLLAVYSVSEGGRSARIAAILVTPAVLGELAFFFAESRETHWFAVISVGAFLVYVVFVVYRQSVFAKGRMTTDRVAGAISVYLLLGLIWALVYGIISAADPSAFQGLESFTLEESGVQLDFVYFSFVTLTTLGYGDISPVSQFAKTLAWFEAVFGQLFLGVTIARLVSLEIAHKDRPPAGD